MSKVQKLVLTGLFTALLCIISPLSIPMPGGIGISLSIFMILLITYIAGVRRSLICCSLYLFIGAVGLPVFAGFQGGFDKLVGATGGFMVGYIILAMVAGVCIYIGKGKRLSVLIGGVVGVLCCYIMGCLWYMFIMKVNLYQALVVCVLPFVIFDIIKIVLVCIIGPIIKKHINWNERLPF